MRNLCYRFMRKEAFPSSCPLCFLFKLNVVPCVLELRFESLRFEEEISDLLCSSRSLSVLEITQVFCLGVFSARRSAAAQAAVRSARAASGAASCRERRRRQTGGEGSARAPPLLGTGHASVSTSQERSRGRRSARRTRPSSELWAGGPLGSGAAHCGSS